MISLLIACACRLLESLIESGCDPLEDCGALLQAANAAVKPSARLMGQNIFTMEPPGELESWVGF